MDYVCIKCRTRWRIGDPSDELSGGLCDKCITKYIRKKQRARGFHDCFRRATEVCDHVDCTYYELCLKILPERSKDA